MAKSQMNRKCVERVSWALGRDVSADEAADMKQAIRYYMAQLRKEDPDAWDSMSTFDRAKAAGDLYAQSLVEEAAKREQRAALTVIAQARLNERLAFHRERGYLGFAAEQQIFQELDRDIRATKSEYATKLCVALDKIRPGFMGIMENHQMATDVVRECLGTETNNELAKQAAQAFRDVSEATRLRFNRAGGNLGRIEDYFPQTHDDARLAHAAEILRGEGRLRQAANFVGNTVRGINRFEENREAWVNFILPLLKRDEYVDLEGNLMDDQGMREMLRKAFENIVTNGAGDLDVSDVAGANARSGLGRANRGNLHRTLIFKDADSFIQYHDTFGRGSYFEVMLKSVQKTAKDAAFLEMLGPNPNNMKRGLDRVAAAEADQSKKIQGRSTKSRIGIIPVESSWRVLTGEASVVKPGREVFASINQGARNLEVVGKLQSTFLTAVSDIPTYFISAGMNRIPLLTAATNLVKALGVESTELATRAGVMADVLSANLVRFGENNVGSGWTAMLANITMKASLLDTFTNGVRQASMVSQMGSMAKIVRNDWKSLTGYQKRALERIGVTERDWRLWQFAKPFRQGEADFLTTQDIREVDLSQLYELTPPEERSRFEYTERDIDHAATMYVAFLKDESGIASLDPDLGTRALVNIAGGKGTVEGEVIRHLMLFKSFPIAFMRRHLERMSDIAQTDGKAAAARYAAMIVVSTTLAGAISVQMKALVAGRDLQDPTSEEYWWQALSTGGGAGFLSDILIAGLDGQSAYGSPNFLRFLGPVFNTVSDTFDVAKAYVDEGLYDKETKPEAKALRLLRGHMPFVNLWYAKGVFDRAIYNDLMEAASPGYLARIQAWGAKNTGQGFWWRPTEIAPNRAPGVARDPTP